MQLYRPGQARMTSRLKPDSAKPEVEVGGGGGSSNSSTPSPVMPEDDREQLKDGTGASHLQRNDRVDPVESSTGSAAAASSINDGVSSSSSKSMTFRRSNTINAAPAVRSSDIDTQKRLGKSYESGDKRSNNKVGRRERNKYGWDDEEEDYGDSSRGKQNLKEDKYSSQPRGNPTYPKLGRFERSAGKGSTRLNRDRNYKPSQRDDFKTTTNNNNNISADNKDTEQPSVSQATAASDVPPSATSCVSGKRYSRARNSKLAAKDRSE